MKSFESNLKTWRKRKKLTIQQAAATLDVPMRTFQEWLSGRLPRIERQKHIEQKLTL
jgi:transcriptional regulator with XRE-family HTH domain